MSAKVAYLDRSASVKLHVVEAESAPLRSALARWPENLATLLRTEAVRARRRAGNEHFIGGRPPAYRSGTSERLIRYFALKKSM